MTDIKLGKIQGYLEGISDSTSCFVQYITHWYDFDYVGDSKDLNEFIGNLIIERYVQFCKVNNRTNDERLLTLKKMKNDLELIQITDWKQFLLKLLNDWSLVYGIMLYETDNKMTFEDYVHRRALTYQPRIIELLDSFFEDREVRAWTFDTKTNCELAYFWNGIHGANIIFDVNGKIYIMNFSFSD